MKIALINENSQAAKNSVLYNTLIKVAEKYNDTCFSGMIRYERGIDYITKLLTTTSNITCSIENGIIHLK